MRVVLTPGMGIGPDVTARALVEIGDEAAITLIGDGEAIGRQLQAAGLKFESASTVDAVAGVSVVETRGATRHCGGCTGDSVTYAEACRS